MTDPRPPMTAIERAGLAAALLLAAGLMWPIRDYLTDDTFIHLQYARHLAAGEGLVFNAGERVYGCTSPLWVTLLAGGMALGIDGLSWARLLGGLATLASVGLFFALLRRTVGNSRLRAAGTLAWASHAWMARWSLSGMETPLAVALTLAGFVALAGGPHWGARPMRTGALWALAALTRPELALLLVLWGALLLLATEDRLGLRRLVRGAAPAALIYGGWLTFARAYFGTFWPMTLAAKSAGSSTFAFHADNLWRQAQVVGATDGVLAALLATSLLARPARSAPSRAAALRALPWAWIVALPALYLARGVPVLSRYLLVVLPVLGWLAWRGAERWWVGEGSAPARARRAAWLGLAIAALVVAQNLAVWRVKVLPAVRSFTPAFEEGPIRWGRWFERHAPPRAIIAVPDIGAIGFFSRRRVLDLAGLVTPEMIPYLAAETEEEATAQFRFAAFARPDYLVDRAPRAWRLLHDSPFAACLVPIGTAEMPILGIARPEPAVYSFYRVEWAVFDSLRAYGAR